MLRPVPGEQLWVLEPFASDRAKATAPTGELRRLALEMIERGYTIVRESIAPALCDEAVADFRRWCRAFPELTETVRDEYGHYPRLHNFQHASRAAERAFTENRKALAIQDFCFGYRTSLCSSLFYERGSAQPIHRDLPYFCTVPVHFYFGMWVALEDVDEDNGPLLVWPGGHRVPEIDPYEIASRHHPPGTPIETLPQHLWTAYQTEVRQRCEAAGIEPETLTVSKGDTVLWHPLLPHAGAPIRDLSRTRMSLVFHTTPEHVPLYQGDVFFDRDARPSLEPRWSYRERDGRLVADHGDAHFPEGIRNVY